MPRTLRLTRETLTELSADDLALVVGGTAISTTDLAYTLQVACVTRITQ